MFRIFAFFAAEGESATRFILPDPDELLWGSIAFLILLVALMVLGFPKMRKTMAARTDKIRGQLEAAEKTKADAEGVLQQYRQQVAGAQTEANRIIEEAKKTAEALRRDLIARAEADAGEILTRARAEVGAEKERAMAELRTNVADLTIRVAEKVIGRELSNEASQTAFVNQTIAELSTMGNGRN